jgi:aspartate aminotransferase/aminotransferase
MIDRWIADRMQSFDSSGIRRVFDLARSLKDPINLSIGQPDFDVPPSVKDAAWQAIQAGKNGYSPTQGIPELMSPLEDLVRREYPRDGREVAVTSGTSGALVLAMLSSVNPGDEVILFDPYFVMYKALIALAGGVPVRIDTYPDFRVDPDRVASAITPRTKAILFNSPGNPTGVVADESEVRGLAELAARHGILLVSDEIYRHFCFDSPFVSPALFNPETLVIDGFSKIFGMTGWRLGYAHGPPRLIREMIKLQQFTFVCAPTPFQWAGLSALGVKMDWAVEAYRAKRDLIVSGLGDCYEMARPGGAFYVFPRVPSGTSDDFVRRAVERQLLVIPGHIFSARDSHFRISYAASDATLRRGIEVLVELAGK